MTYFFIFESYFCYFQNHRLWGDLLIWIGIFEFLSQVLECSYVKLLCSYGIKDQDSIFVIFIVRFFPLHFGIKVTFCPIGKVRQFNADLYEIIWAGQYEIYNIPPKEKFFVDIPIHSKIFLGIIFSNCIESRCLKRLNSSHKVYLPCYLSFVGMQFFSLIHCHICCKVFKEEF